MEDWPLIMSAEDVANVLGVSKPTVYKIMNDESFPLIQPGPKKVYRDSFIKWLERR